MHTDVYYPQLVELLKPEGQLALIDDPATLDAMPLKRKSISLHWEFMFTRSMYRTQNMILQHRLLERIAALVDDGLLFLMQHGFRVIAHDRRGHGRSDQRFQGNDMEKAVLIGIQAGRFSVQVVPTRRHAGVA